MLEGHFTPYTPQIPYVHTPQRRVPVLADVASSMQAAWIGWGTGSLQGTVNGLAACQYTGRACVSPSAMGDLTIVAGSVDTSTTPSVLVFTVEGTWTKNSVATDCEMQVNASFITCPGLGQATPEKCKQVDMPCWVDCS